MDIDKLKTQLKELEKKNRLNEKVLSDNIQKMYNDIFDDSTLIRSVITESENIKGDNFYMDHDFISYVIEIDLDKFVNKDPDCSYYLENYLLEYCIHYDAFNGNYPTITLGPGILVYDDRSVYDSDECETIIGKNDLSDNDLMKVINEYQDKKGVYNWIFKVDYYGNLEQF